jgi:hypothetical protein
MGPTGSPAASSLRQGIDDIFKGDQKMDKNGLIFLSFLILLFFPTLALSDCADLGRSTGWAVQGDQTIIYYMQNAPVATVVLQDCAVNASSSIRLLKTYLCDSDTVLVDGQECSIMSVTLASAP